MTRVAVVGAAGRMGRMLVEAIAVDGQCQLGAAIIKPGDSLLGVDAGELVGVGTIEHFIKQMIWQQQSVIFDVLIDFTTPELTMDNVALCRRTRERSW